MVTDCHTHDRRRHDAIISVAPTDFHPEEGCVYSVGIHPWLTDHRVDINQLAEAAAHPAVVAIGETGIDHLRGAATNEQKRIFESHIELSERLRKPLILHVVKAVDEILATRKAAKPRMPWIWHGYRGNAVMARQLTGKGIYLSLGERFNPQAAAAIDRDMLLLESDESELTIAEIAERVAASRNEPADAVLLTAARCLRRVMAYTV